MLRRDGSASSSDDDRGSRGAASSRTHPERLRESEEESAAGESAVRSAQSRATEDEARRHRAQSERRSDSGSGESSENERRPRRNDGGRERGVSRAERPLSPSEGESSESENRETLLDPSRGSRGHDNLSRSEVRRDGDRSGDSRVHFTDPIARHDGRERRKWSAEHPISSKESEVEPASTDWRRAAQRRALRNSDRAKRQPTAADHSADASGSSSSDGRPRRRRAGRERAKPAPEPKGAAERRREWESRRGEDDSRDDHRRQTHVHNLSPASPEPFARPSLAASQQWLARPDAKIDAESLEAITREIAMYNHKHWSAGANQLIGRNVEGEERSLLETLKHLNMNAVARKASFVPLSSSRSERWDPMEPDVSGMERSGINQRTRDGAERTYAPGSLPKVRTAINRWLQWFVLCSVDRGF